MGLEKVALHPRRTGVVVKFQVSLDLVNDRFAGPVESRLRVLVDQMTREFPGLTARVGESNGKKSPTGAEAAGKTLGTKLYGSGKTSAK